ncbi:MAG: hypothetical protein IT428_29125 [Planctomycetaceae bacterium]|nr:hypothetical protein [Planctomycetaceae bacterium]
MMSEEQWIESRREKLQEGLRKAERLMEIADDAQTKLIAEIFLALCRERLAALDVVLS